MYFNMKMVIKRPNKFDFIHVSVCEECEIDAKANRAWQRFCSRACHDKHHNRQKALKKANNAHIVSA